MHTAMSCIYLNCNETIRIVPLICEWRIGIVDYGRWREGGLKSVNKQKLRTHFAHPVLFKMQT